MRPSASQRARTRCHRTFTSAAARTMSGSLPTATVSPASPSQSSKIGSMSMKKMSFWPSTTPGSDGSSKFLVVPVPKRISTLCQPLRNIDSRSTWMAAARPSSSVIPGEIRSAIFHTASLVRTRTDSNCRNEKQGSRSPNPAPLLLTCCRHDVTIRNRADAGRSPRSVYPHYVSTVFPPRKLGPSQCRRRQRPRGVSRTGDSGRHSPEAPGGRTAGPGPAQAATLVG